ncbi:MAG: hypothetical protein AB8G17_01220 [Gammaproteobacteria bacterium]
MTKWLDDKRVVAALALLACGGVTWRVVLPLLPENFDEESVPVDEFDTYADGAISANAAQPQLKLATAHFDLRNIDVSDLFFNQNPKRDPFISAPIQSAPLAEVTIESAAEPLEQKTEALPTLPTLVAVILSDDKSAAVIDNQIVRVGDRIAGFRIRDIQRNRVTLAAASNRIFELGIDP